MATLKKFEAYLLLHWKTGRISLRKKKPTSVSPYEIPVRIGINVQLPEVQEIVAKGDITLSQVKADEMLIESL